MDGVEAAAGARQALAAMVSALADAVAVGAGESAPAAPVARVHGALEVRRLADRLLAATVEAARDEGVTWAQLGEALGTTRQAAFQRFGRPIDPRTDRPMDAALTGADEIAVEVFAALAAARWPEVTARFDETMAGALPADTLAGTWAQVVGTVGAYEGQGEPFVRRQGLFTVVDVPLRFEAGDLTGRLTLRDDARIAGLYLLTESAAAKESRDER